MSRPSSDAATFVLFEPLSAARVRRNGGFN
jgi:hypothetical protein